MARIETYKLDTRVRSQDVLIGSSYEGEGQNGPIYVTRSYRADELAKYMNLVFTVDEVNYNLNDWKDHLDYNYSITLDGNNNISSLISLFDEASTEMRFDVGSFRLWNSATDESAVPFEIRSGLVKLKKSFYDVSFGDIPDVPETFILTTVYADDYQGSNQSLTRDTRNFYGIYQGPAKLTEEDLPVIGVDWNQITGDPGSPGDSAIAIKLLASKHVIIYDTGGAENPEQEILFTTSIQNFGPNSIPQYIFYVNGEVFQAKSTVDTFTLPDDDEPSHGGSTTVKVELYDGDILVGEDSVTVYGVKDGTDSITAFLTNEAHVVVADNDEEVLPGGLFTAGGIFKVFIGADDVTTQCTYSYVPFDPGEFAIQVVGEQSSGEGITVDIGENTGVYVVTALDLPQAYVDFQATIPAAVGKRAEDTVVTRRYSIAKSIKGGKGDEGIPGVNARTVKLTATPQQVVLYDQDGDKQAVDITLTATALNFTTPEYRFLKDGIEVQAFGPENTYTILTSGNQHPPANQADDWRVEVREDFSTEYLAFDVLNIYGLQAGKDGYTVILSNDSHTIQESFIGEKNYAGSGTTIQVWRGTEKLRYNHAGTLVKGEWRIHDVIEYDITAPPEFEWTGDGTFEAVIGPYFDNMTADVARVIYQIEPHGLDVATLGYLEKQQSFSVSKQGETGEPGQPGEPGIPGLPGEPGPDGRRTAEGVIWYGQGSESPPTDPINPDSNNNGVPDIVYDFSDASFNAYPTGWQRDSPALTPGTNDSIFYTARYTVYEELNSQGQPSGIGYPSFGPARNAFVFNQVVAFQSEDLSKGQTQIDGGFINTVQIKSSNYVPPDIGETFAGKGMVIDLNGSQIVSKHLVLKSTETGSHLYINGGGTFTGTLSGVDGNFSGTLTGSTGVFGGVTLNANGISSTEFSIDANGNATFNGDLTGASGTFSGTLQVGTGNGQITIDSNGISVGSGNFSINSSGDATFAGSLSGASITGTTGTFGGVTLDSNGLSAAQFSIDGNGNASFNGSLDVGTVVIDDGYITMQSNSATLEGTIQFVDSSNVYSGSIYASNTANQRGISMYSADKSVIAATNGASIELYGDTFTVDPGHVNVYSTNGTNINGGPLTVIDLNIVGSTIAATGYTKLANGLILQWATVNNDNSGYTDGFWPVTFGTRCIGAVATRVNASSAATISGSGTPSDPPPNNNAVNLSYSKDKYEIDFNDTGTTVFIMALGY